MRSLSNNACAILFAIPLRAIFGLHSWNELIKHICQRMHHYILHCFVKRIGAAVARHQGIEELVATRQLFQRLSVTLMRGNAALLMSRRPDTDMALPEVDGIV